MSIAAIIVNYQAGSLVLDHAEATLSELRAHRGSKLFVVDNASPNGDAALLADGLGDQPDVEVIAAPRNGGFSYGNNIGVAAALAQKSFDYLYFLNPDAYPLPGCLAALTAFLADTPEAGVVGSKLVGDDGAPQRSAFRFPGLASEFSGSAATGPISALLRRFEVAMPVADEAHRADWVCGASMMMPREVWDAVGPMDEDYFLYFEETDFQRAAIKAGFEVWYLPEARAIHLVGQSTGVVDSKTADERAPDYWYDSRWRYLTKNHGPAYAAAADAARRAGHGVQRLRARFGKATTAGGGADTDGCADARARANGRKAS